MEILLTKTNATLAPADMHASEYVYKLKPGATLIADVRQPRNPLFHRKFMSLLRVGFEYWQPGEVDKKHGVPEKNFDQFREDVTILAGFYFPVVRTDGTVRIKAKSISFASMDEEEFDGEMPESMWVALCHSDKISATEICRVIVRVTKMGILNRINGKN